MMDTPPEITRLQLLAEEYHEIVQRMQDASLVVSAEEVDALGAERALLHDDLIAEFARLGHPVANRKEAHDRAFNLTFWLQDVGLALGRGRSYTHEPTYNASSVCPPRSPR